MTRECGRSLHTEMWNAPVQRNAEAHGEALRFPERGRLPQRAPPILPKPDNSDNPLCDIGHGPRRLVPRRPPGS
jgi:hypothetical protein